MFFSIIISIITILHSPEPVREGYWVKFYKIDNMAEIIVNDSIVYSSGLIDFNPDLNEQFEIFLGGWLTDQKDEVVIRLFNGQKPYEVDQKDQHWEIEYAILKDGTEIEYNWDSEDDYKQGMVFEQKYYY